MAHLAERSQRIVADFLTHQTGDGLAWPIRSTSPAPFLEMTTRLMTDPAKLLQIADQPVAGHMDLWQSARGCA